MVPGSTLMYGSSFISDTLRPRASRRQPIEEAAKPFPRLETTPPVTKMYLVIAIPSNSFQYWLIFWTLVFGLWCLVFAFFPGLLPTAYCLLLTAYCLPPAPVHHPFPAPRR